MAEVTYGDFIFKGTLTVTLNRTGLAEGTGRTVNWLENQGGFSVYDNSAATPFEELWLLPPLIAFHGSVRVTGPVGQTGWTVGFIQTITRLTRDAFYSGGKSRQMRMDTGSGSLKDGQADSIFYDTTKGVVIGAFRGVTAGSRVVTVADNDTPNFKMPTLYSGDPGNPQFVGTGMELGKLERTAGKDKFTTYLAAVHEATKTIITLADSSWRVSWDGAYDFDKKTWVRDTAGQFLKHQEWDRAVVYADLRTNKLTAGPPFSLFLEEAEEACQIQGPGGWTPCKIGSGQPLPLHNRSLSRWND